MRDGERINEWTRSLHCDKEVEYYDYSEGKNGYIKYSIEIANNNNDSRQHQHDNEPIILGKKCNIKKWNTGGYDSDVEYINEISEEEYIAEPKPSLMNNRNGEYKNSRNSHTGRNRNSNRSFINERNEYEDNRDSHSNRSFIHEELDEIIPKFERMQVNQEFNSNWRDHFPAPQRRYPDEESKREWTELKRNAIKTGAKKKDVLWDKHDLLDTDTFTF